MLDNSRPIVGLRRTHRKSRTGCKTCRERHIRCDEETPVCRNCEKSGRRCLYVNKAKEDSPTSVTPVGLVYTFPALEAAKLPSQEVFLLQYLTQFREYQFVDNKYSDWMKRVPAMIGEYRFLLDAALGLSAAHHSLATSEPDSAQLALYYRGRGLKGLQDALGNFSESNADAVLAASIMLTWYMCDWREWSSLTHGIRAIQITMQPFAERSVFLALIEEQAIIPEEMLPAPSTTTESRKPLPRDVAALDELIDRLQDVEIYLAANEGEAEGALINQVLEFAKMLKGKIPMISTDDQFESSRVLRVALVKVPVEMLQRIRINPRTIVAISYFYATALAVAPLFPAMGAMFFGHLALAPITGLGRYMEDQRNDPIAARKFNWDEAAGYMAYAMETVRRFRARLGWSTPPSPLSPTTYTLPSPSTTTPYTNQFPNQSPPG